MSAMAFTKPRYTIGQGELISRNGNTIRSFADLATWIAEHLRVESAVLDGEMASSIQQRLPKWGMLPSFAFGISVAFPIRGNSLRSCRESGDKAYTVASVR
jgi:hypothetical protein